MGERKVLNKYYPPDFDPSKLQRARKPNNQQIKVRTMLPMTIRCNKCSNYMFKGTKFNSRKETADRSEAYLGIEVHRFYFKCSHCSAEISLKTDPRNSGYVVEHGARVTRCDHQEEEENKKTYDSMKALEVRMLDSKREMEISANLNELMSLKSRQERVSHEAALEAALRGSKDCKQAVAEEISNGEVLPKPIFHCLKRKVKQQDRLGEAKRRSSTCALQMLRQSYDHYDDQSS